MLIRSSATSAAVLSLCTGVAVLALKWVAYRLTGSVALYSDALESVINVAAAVAALFAVHVSARPPDTDHPYGHSKAEYFSAVLEGALIVVAAVAIVNDALRRLTHPLPLTRLTIGLSVSTLASVLNGLVATHLLRAGRRLRSPALRADGLHLWTDVATSAGVLAGILLAAATQIWVLDPVLALIVAANIVRVGIKLVVESVGGLMDRALGQRELDKLEGCIRPAMGGALDATLLRTRRAGTSTFIELRLVVPADMSVKVAHEICDRIEEAVGARMPGAQVMIHVEPAAER